MTIINDDINKKGFIKNIHWGLIPRALVLFLSILFGWAIFWKKG
jgi:hypothetical protein